MYYHVIVYTATNTHLWINCEYDFLLKDVLIPYVNKQVVSVNYNPGKAIFNYATVTYLRIFKTNEELPSEIEEAEKTILSDEFIKNECTQDVFERVLLSKSSWESKSLLQTLFMPTKPQVFVVMKFGDKVLDSAYEGAIKPIVKKFKYRTLRIDEIQDSGRITNQILEEIAQSAVVLADLTGERPNCYYEAGFAHAIGKEIVFTIKKGAIIHFDLAGHRFIEWDTEEELRKELLKRFKAIQKRAE